MHSFRACLMLGLVQIWRQIGMLWQCNTGYSTALSCSRVVWCGPTFRCQTCPKKGGEKRPQKMNAKRVQRQLLDTFCVHFWGPLFAPFFGPLISPQKGSNDKAAVQASWFDSIITNRLKLCCSRTVGRHSMIRGGLPFLNALVKRVDAHVASVE